MRIAAAYIIAVLVIISCRQENGIPKKIIERNRMQELLWDMIRADVFINDFAGRNDTAFNRLKESIGLYQQIFEVHRTSRSEFSKSLQWYQQHPAQMKIILDTLHGRQNKIMQERSKPSVRPTDSFTPDSLK